MKRNFISVTWTPGVDIGDAQTLGRTIEDIYSLLRPHFGVPDQFDPLPAVRVFGAWSIPSVPREAAYSNIEWYVRRSLASDEQHILASRYLETVVLEPWQGTTPHFDLALTELALLDDLTEDAAPSEALGFCQPGLVSLISTAPFGEIENPSHRKLALQHVFAHYVGRMFDVPRISRSGDVEERHGRLYCTNPCAIRFTHTPTQALDFAKQQVAEGAVYCDACQRDIAAQITGFHYGLN
jgi:hypothetical protein